MIIKKKLIFFALILVLIPLVSAGNYGEGIYGSGNYSEISTPSLYCGDGICNNGESCSTCPGDCGACPTTPNPGGGSSGGSRCTYDWQCTEWFPSICPESGIQERICANKGDCTGTKGMPNQTQICEYLGPSEPLFDIYLNLEDGYKEICSGKKIKANVKLENYAKVELLDAFMTYWIIDKNNKLITEYKDTRAVEKETSFNIELKVPDSASQGTYRLYAEITYSGNKTAVAGETFEVLSQEECALLPVKNFNWMYLVYGIIGVVAVLLILLIIRLFKSKFKIIKKKVGKPKTHKEYKSKIKKNLKRIKGKTFLIILVGFMLVGILFIGRNTMTGFVVGGSSIVNNNWNVLGFLLIIGLFGLMAFVYKKKIIEKIEINRINKHPKNSIKGLIKKEVYCGEGNYIGKVDEVLLGENKIDSLRIRLDKKQNLKTKGIIVKYKNVKSIGHIVIVDENILEKLES